MRLARESSFLMPVQGAVEHEGEEVEGLGGGFKISCLELFIGQELDSLSTGQASSG